MKMRYAKPEDYEEYERLYNDLQCETLYCGREEINPQEQEEAIKYFAMDEETRKFIENEDRRTLEKFLADLQKDYVRIYMCVDNKQTVGFVQLFKLCGRKWKLAYLCLAPEYQTAEALSEIVEYLHNKSNMSQIDVCAFGNGEELFQKIGFQKILAGYYRKQKVKG